jgi:hypothetical protein
MYKQLQENINMLRQSTHTCNADEVIPAFIYYDSNNKAGGYLLSRDES